MMQQWWYNIGGGGHFSEANLSRNHDTNICWLGGLVDHAAKPFFHRYATEPQWWYNIGGGATMMITCQQKNSSLHSNNLFPLIVTLQLRNKAGVAPIFFTFLFQFKSPIPATSKSEHIIKWQMTTRHAPFISIVHLLQKSNKWKIGMKGWFSFLMDNKRKEINSEKRNSNRNQQAQQQKRSIRSRTWI